MAVTVVPSEITGEPVEYEGTRKTRLITITVTPNGGNYTSAGLIDTTNMPANFQRKFGIDTLLRAVPQTTLRRANYASAYPCELDLVTAATPALVLYGGATTAAEDTPLEEIPNATALVNVALTATFKLIGY